MKPVNDLWISVDPRIWSQRLWRIVRAPARRILILASTILVLLSLLRFDTPLQGNLDSNLDRLLAGRQFDFAGWWAQAFTGKVLDELTIWQNGMTAEKQTGLVLAYMRDLTAFQLLEARIEAIYVDPQVTDKHAASAVPRAERDALRASLNARQNLTEAILQEQVESVLREEGFALGGQVWPPVRFRFTELPDMVIISRRDTIDRIASRELQTGLTVDRKDDIEREIDERFNVSSLVTPIGGLGAYPTMLPETSALRWVLSVIAHEWTHNYFLFVLSAIGWNYAEDRHARTMNETAAEIVEREIGKRVVERYYPDLLTAEDTRNVEQETAGENLIASIASDTSPVASQASPSSRSVSSVSTVSNSSTFDFRKEMRETRVRTDDLLAEGKIEAAEAYMEQRRQLFVKNGYPIRKLNQAYFAFHGAYNAEPGGAAAAGRDPVGPAVQLLRQRSATLGNFVREMSRVQSFEDLLSRVR